MKKIFMAGIIMIGLSSFVSAGYSTIYECTEAGYDWCPFSDRCITGGGDCSSCKKGEGCNSTSCSKCSASCKICTSCGASSSCSTCSSCPAVKK